MAQAIISRPQKQLSTQLKSSGTNVFLGLFQFIVLSLVLLVALDFVLTFAGVADEESLDLEPVTGWTAIPNREFTYRSEGYAHSKYNSFGMHDQERTIEKPGGTFRVAVLGCSLTEAKEVSLNENYCNLLDKVLKERGDGRYEVLNFAVAAYSIPQEYLRLKTFVLRFHPALVIFTVRPNSLLYMGNDPNGGFVNARPTFGVTADGKLIEDRHYQQYWLNSRAGKRMQQMRWFRIHSRLWSVYGRSITKLEAFFRWPPAILRKFSVKKHKHTPNLELGRDANAEKARAYLGRTASALIKDAKELCDKKNCKFVLMYMPTSKAKRTQQEDEIFHQIATSQELPYLDLNGTFDRLELTNSKLYFKDHMTKYGHKEVAARINDFLKDNALLR